MTLDQRCPLKSLLTTDTLRPPSGMRENTHLLMLLHVPRLVLGRDTNLLAFLHMAPKTTVMSTLLPRGVLLQITLNIDEAHCPPKDIGCTPLPLPLPLPLQYIGRSEWYATCAGALYVDHLPHMGTGHLTVEGLPLLHPTTPLLTTDLEDALLPLPLDLHMIPGPRGG